MKKEGHFALLFKKTVAIVKSPRYPGRQSSPDAAAREVNQKYGIPADATVFLFVGRINFIKNIDFTVRALARAKELGLKNFRMLFAGRGQDEEKLAALVQELGLAEEVVMCGLTDKPMLEKLYSRASLFLFPSLYDANSLVQIEAPLHLLGRCGPRRPHRLPPPPGPLLTGHIPVIPSAVEESPASPQKVGVLSAKGCFLPYQPPSVIPSEASVSPIIAGS